MRGQQRCHSSRRVRGARREHRARTAARARGQQRVRRGVAVHRERHGVDHDGAEGPIVQHRGEHSGVAAVQEERRVYTGVAQHVHGPAQRIDAAGFAAAGVEVERMHARRKLPPRARE
jgi:hypothetical protein